jgi:hypothetical protein
MALITTLVPSTPLEWAGVAALVLLSPFLYYFAIWLVDPLSLRRFPGPPLAALTPYWLFWQRRHVRGFRSVDEAHKVFIDENTTDCRNMENLSALPLIRLVSIFLTQFRFAIHRYEANEIASLWSRQRLHESRVYFLPKSC